MELAKVPTIDTEPIRIVIADAGTLGGTPVNVSLSLEGTRLSPFT